MARGVHVSPVVMTQSETPIRELHLPILVHTTDMKGKALTETAKVVDVSASGARLSWVRNLKQTGQFLEIEFRGKKAKYRVAWIGEPKSKHEGQVGVETIQPEVDLWGLPKVEVAHSEAVATLPAAEPTRSVGVVSSWSGADRRATKRLNCSGAVEFQAVGSALRSMAMVSDICVGGCYIETRTPLPAETRLEFTLRFTDAEISGTGEVRVCHQGMGMGIAFREMTPENRERLEDLISELAGTGSRKTATPPRGVEAKNGATMELLLFLVDTLKEKGVLTPEEHSNALSRALKSMSKNGPYVR